MSCIVPCLVVLLFLCLAIWLVTLDSKGSGLFARVRSAMTSIGAENHSNPCTSADPNLAYSTPLTTQPPSTTTPGTEALPYSKPWVQPLPGEMESPETDKPWDGLSLTTTDEPDSWVWPDKFTTHDIETTTEWDRVLDVGKALDVGRRRRQAATSSESSRCNLVVFGIALLYIYR